MQASAEFRQEKHELDAVLASGIFNRAPNLALLLRYICARYFEGAADQIKEYNIAVEALGRPADFDQKRDSIVRVEAHRLRKRLREYYEAEGADHAIRIEIPSGQYAPRFQAAQPPSPSLIDVTLVTQDEVAANGTGELQPGGMSLAPSPAQIIAPEPAPRAPGHGARNALIALALLLAGAGSWALWLRPKETAGKLSGIAPVAASPANPRDVRILVGHLGPDYTDRQGRVWQSDRYFQGGSVFESHDHPIYGTREPRIYQSRREGAFSYDIPLPPGDYELRLHFAETLYGEDNVAGGGESSRVFNVWINDREALHEFDVIAEAGASTADVRAFKDITPAADGKLHLRFEPFSNPPQLSAIEITPGTPGRLLPIRMVALDRVYVDKQGREWEPDRYARGGQVVVRSRPVAGDYDPELFRGERFGNLHYAIPVPPGRYGVTFYFAEAWFGPDTPAGGGAGSRVFDILCNGLALRRGFDIFKEAHGGERGITWTAHGLEPNPQGKLDLALPPARNYSCVNALEVLDESK